MIERRRELRQPSRLQVDISQAEHYIGRFSTANSGDHSVFVEMEPARLEAGDVLMVSFITDAGVSQRLTHLAEITRVSDLGVAIVFSQICRPSDPRVPLPRRNG